MRSRTALWAWGVPLGLPFLYGLLFQSMTLVTLLSLFAIAFVPIALFSIVATTVASARTRDRRRPIATGAAALLLLAEAVCPSIFWQPLYTAGLWGGLAPFYGSYKERVAALPQDKGPRLLAIDLGYAGPLGHALIYDESDRVARRPEPGGRGIGWATNGQIEPCDGRSIRLARHYYACTYWQEF